MQVHKKSSPKRLLICLPKDNQKKSMLLMQLIKEIPFKSSKNSLSTGSTGVSRDGSQLDHRVARIVWRPSCSIIGFLKSAKL